MSAERPITEDDLHAYVDGALKSHRVTEIERYFEDHPDVALRIQAYADQRKDLRAALAPIIAEPLPSRLNLSRMIEHRRTQGTMWRRVAAAVALVALGGVGGWSARMISEPTDSGVAALALEAADAYAVYEPDHMHPVEIRAENRDDLVRWMTARLGRAVMLPDLSGSGYRLMGGRILATSRGPAGLLMYTDEGGVRLVLMTRPMIGSDAAHMVEQTPRGMTSYAWSDQGMGYSLIGSTSPAILHPLADDVRRQIAAGV